MTEEDAAERVRRRILEWTRTAGHGSKKQLAEAIVAKYGEHLSSSWVTGLLKDGDKNTPLNLHYLDDVADAIGLAPGELVARDGDHYLELIPTEFRLVKYFRHMPDAARQHWIAWLDACFSSHAFDWNSESEQHRRAVAAARLARERIARDRRRKRA